MTAKPRGGPASNRPRESAFPKLSVSHRIEEGLLPMSLILAPKSSKEQMKNMCVLLCWVPRSCMRALTGANLTADLDKRAPPDS